MHYVEYSLWRVLAEHVVLRVIKQASLCHVMTMSTSPHKYLFTTAEMHACMIKVVLLLSSEGDTTQVIVRHKQGNMGKRGISLSPPNQGGTVERTSCP